MLNQKSVDEEEEAIRIWIQTLSDNDKVLFYKKVKTKIKDPDTYAALNWFFICGIHHFYLQKWLMGFIDLSIFTLGIVLLILGYTEIGTLLIIILSSIELWALFRSQIIIQDWNNKVYKTILNEFSH
jgi:TM2 domain-containing membrane protein YozV